MFATIYAHGRDPIDTSRQIKVCLAHCMRLGLGIGQILADVEQAPMGEGRPALRELVGREGRHTLIVTDLDVLDDGTGLLAPILEKGWPVHSAIGGASA